MWLLSCWTAAVLLILSWRCLKGRGLKEPQEIKLSMLTLNKTARRECDKLKIETLSLHPKRFLAVLVIASQRAVATPK